MNRSTQSAGIPDNKASLINALLKDKNGMEATILSLEQEEDEVFALLLLEDGQTVRAGLSAMEIEGDGKRLYSPRSFEEFNSVHPDDQLVIPVVLEELRIDRSVVETGKGVRIVKQVHEHEEKVIVPLLQENMSVEHVEIGRIVSADDLPVARQEGDTYIVPVLEEVLVLEKKICLKKEVRITRKKQEISAVEKIRLRREEVSVERFNEEDVQNK